MSSAYVNEPTPGRPGDGTGATNDPSIGELFSAVSQDLSTLIRQEVALARAEVRQSAVNAGAGVGMLGGAGVAVHMVLLFLSISAWWGIAQFIGQAWSGLVIAIIWAIIAAIFYSVGRNKLKQVEGVPRTTETAKQIPTALAGNEETR
ncbi:MAG: phage holin family protein [Pseudonocardiales bacterium]